MFQNLRQGNQIYILNKTGKPVLETGIVVSVSTPMPKYQVPPVFGQPQEMTVDLIVKVGGQDVNYQRIPASSDIADFGTTGIVLSDNKEAMNAEVVSLKNKSVDAINSVDFHRDIVSGCDKILEVLNPEFAERQQQQMEINTLKDQMRELMELNKSLLAKLDSGSSA